MKHLTAFEKYLISLPNYEATLYLIHCLKNGEPDNQAWALMAEFNGEKWSCKPEDLPKFVSKTIMSLGLKEITMSPVST